jgi:adhesin transport system membrane fusion protein
MTTSQIADQQKQQAIRTKLNALLTKMKRSAQKDSDDYQFSKNVSRSLVAKIPLNHIILWTTFVFFTLMIVWAYFAILDEVTHATGKVIPSQKIQVIQNLEGGIIKEIAVKEGQVVNKNQVLLRIDDTRFSSNYRANKLQALGLQAKIERLQAEADNQSFKPSDKLVREVPELIQYEESLYTSRKNELNILLDGKKLLLQEINMTKPLVKEGAVSKVEVLRLEQRLNDMNRTISNFLSRILYELNDAKITLSKLEENNHTLKDQLERTAIRSPVRGIVKQIYVSTVGGVVKPGMPLIEIVPLDDTLLIEACVKPNDIGFIHLGQNANVKITAYDFSIYGGLRGQVEHISADTSIDRRGSSFYEIWVRTDRNYLEKNGHKLNIIPGMQASVDILTGKKSVLNYLLKPILKTKYNALRER